MGGAVIEHRRQPAGRRPAILVLGLLASLTLPLRAADWEPARLVKNGEPETFGEFPESATAVRRMLGAALAAHDGARIRTALHTLAAMGYSPTQETMNLLFPYVPADEQASLAQRFAAN